MGNNSQAIQVPNRADNDVLSRWPMLCQALCLFTPARCLFAQVCCWFTPACCPFAQAPCRCRWGRRRRDDGANRLGTHASHACRSHTCGSHDSYDSNAGHDSGSRSREAWPALAARSGHAPATPPNHETLLAQATSRGSAEEGSVWRQSKSALLTPYFLLQSVKIFAPQVGKKFPGANQAHNILI